MYHVLEAILLVPRQSSHSNNNDDDDDDIKTVSKGTMNLHLLF